MSNPSNHPPIDCHTVSTADVAPAHVPDYWRHCLCDTYIELDCELPGDTRTLPYSGTIGRSSLNGLEISTRHTGLLMDRALDVCSRHRYVTRGLAVR